MREILPTIQAWRDAGKPMAIATVVLTKGSAPRREGARLLISAEGDMVGSVSGGCVENDVIVHAQDVIKTGEPCLVRYAITDDMIWDVGLACGGTVEVWIERLPDTPHSPELWQFQSDLEDALGADRMVAQAILLGGQGRPGTKLLIWPLGATRGSLGDRELNAQVTADALAMMARPRAESREYPRHDARVFVEVLPPPPHLVILGGVHIAIPLTTIAKTLGFRVSIADPRRQFANRERFPHADQIIAAWPQEAVAQIDIGPTTYCVILTHDPKIDEPALISLLGKGAGYIGAIGSRNTHVERRERMAARGVSKELLDDVFAPVGLDLGGQEPEEIALSIMAEIIAVRNQAPAGFMRDRRPPAER